MVLNLSLQILNAYDFVLKNNKLKLRKFYNIFLFLFNLHKLKIALRFLLIKILNKIKRLYSSKVTPFKISLKKTTKFLFKKFILTTFFNYNKWILGNQRQLMSTLKKQALIASRVRHWFNLWMINGLVRYHFWRQIPTSEVYERSLVPHAITVIWC